MKFQIKTQTRDGLWYVSVSHEGQGVHSGFPSFMTRDEASEYGRKIADLHVEKLAKQAEDDKSIRYEDYETVSDK